MYVPRRPNVDVLARQAGHKRFIDQYLTERAEYAAGWRYLNTAGNPSGLAGFPGQPLGFFKDSEGWVMLRGQPAYVLLPEFPGDPTPFVTYPGMSTGGGTAFVLPDGYRPARMLYVPGDTRIDTNGTVTIRSQGGQPFTVVVLDGIRFRTN